MFVQTDNLAGNAIVAYDRGPDGALHQAGTFTTGGKGGALSGAVVDFLASQGPGAGSPPPRVSSESWVDMRTPR